MSGSTATPWLTIEQLCERFQIPITTARWWRAQRTGPPAVKVGRFIRYRIADVEEWEASLSDPYEALGRKDAS